MNDTLHIHRHQGALTISGPAAREVAEYIAALVLTFDRERAVEQVRFMFGEREAREQREPFNRG